MLLCAATWFIPGLGYVLVKDYARGFTLMVLISLCFAVGVLLGGVVQPPVWNMQSPEFNWVGILNYLVTSFFGLGWLGMQLLHGIAANDAEHFFNASRMAARSPFWDLGAFHLITAAALNYLSVVRLYDLLAGNPELMTGGDKAAETNVSTGKP